MKKLEKKLGYSMVNNPLAFNDARGLFGVVLVYCIVMESFFEIGCICDKSVTFLTGLRDTIFLRGNE